MTGAVLQTTKRRSELAIQTIMHQIVEKFQPEKIILFGSHAYSDPGPASDVDLLAAYQKALTINLQTSSDSFLELLFEPHLTRV